VHSFPVVRRNHFNGVPGTAIEERTIRTFADAFLAANTEIGIDFDAPKRRRSEEHTSELQSHA